MFITGNHYLYSHAMPSKLDAVANTERIAGPHHHLLDKTRLEITLCVFLWPFNC